MTHGDSRQNLEPWVTVTRVIEVPKEDEEEKTKEAEINTHIPWVTVTHGPVDTVSSGSRQQQQDELWDRLTTNARSKRIAAA